VTELSGFRHRTNYVDLPDGRDRYIVAAVGAWLSQIVPGYCAERTVLDVGCGGQPLRGLIESSGGRYTGMDVVQNQAGSVTVLSPIDAALPEPWPDAVVQYDLLICSEVLEHVRDWPRAFGNLRRLARPDGHAILTVPFLFPLHMEPHDYYRATPYAIGAIAETAGFSVEAFQRLGTGLDVLKTIASDLSVLPVMDGVWPRVKTRVLRMARRGLLAALDSSQLTHGVEVNANSYLSGGVILGPPA
jgi:SAM-dependent methyltransferase